MKTEIIFMYIGGIMFGFGLALSGMAIPEVVLSFLYLEDFGLLLVMAAALITTLITFQLAPHLLKQPVTGGIFPGKKNIPVTKQTIVGAVIFGIGWGISGLCPATSITALGMGNWPVALGVAGMFLGTFIYGSIRSR
jgi:uncharacterized membrane protein YedE/YeeE